MADPVLVIGALGNVGAEVVMSLQALGQPVRAADLDAEKIRARFGDGVEAVAFDFFKPETYPRAFEGARRMFLMRPPQIADTRRRMIPALEAARAAGVRHAAFLSLIGIEQARYAPHYPVEQYLIGSTMQWSFLRCSFFMQNLNTTHRQEIRERSEIFIPVGRARTSFIDVRDIGLAGATVLSQPGHENRAYDLTGPEALDYWQVAQILSETLGRPITYRNPSPARFLLSHLRRGTALPFAVVMTGLYLSTRRGMAERVTGELERVTGQKPRTLRQYAQDYAAAWR